MAIGIGERYTLHERLGEGGVGVVYRAHDLAAGRDVALKTLKPGASEEDRLRLKQEFRAMTRLRHPHLCEALDLGSLADGAPYFTMELIPGSDLAAQLPMPPQRLLALLPQLASALDHLHRQGLVHGDVKPENVRVSPDGRLKLMDLGLMTAAGEIAGAPRGTLAYMAPEVVRGDRVDQRADIYALGAMCYHLLSGVLPFEGKTPLEVLRAHLTRRPRALRTLDPAIPPALDQAIQKMVACEPVARPRSLAEVLGILGLASEDDDTRPLTGAFIGRQAEITAFQEALGGLAGEGRGRALWIAGATGTGKSRLLDELRVLAQLEEVPFLLGRCADRAAPFGPFVRILRGMLPLVREALQDASEEQRGALGLLLPELGSQAPAPDLEPREERVLLQSAIAHVLRAVAGRRGAVIALDDWDRADAASAETLAYLRRNEQGVRFVFVVTAREQGYLDKAATALAPLTQAEVAALAGSILGEAEVPEDFAAALWRWTGGHAGHVQHVVEHLRRTGALARKQGRWAFPEDLARCDLGAGFREMVLAPLAALTKPATQLAELAAVLGQEAELAALAELAGLEEDVLFSALDELRARRIVERVGAAVVFTSGGLADAVYSRMQEGRRLWLHAAAAARVEKGLADDPPSDVAARSALAHHYVRSMQVVKALPATLLAADLNAAVFAMDEARGLLRDGLGMTATEPEKYRRERRDLLQRLADVERWRGDFDAMNAALDEALPLAEQLGDPEPLARLLVLRGASYNQRMTPAAFELAITCLERADGLLSVDGGALRARGRFFLGQAHYYLGRTDAARAAFEATIASPQAPAFWRAKALAFQGYLIATGPKAERDLGFGLLAEAAEIQQGLRDVYGLGFTAALQGDALLQMLRLPEAEQAVSRQVAVAEELGVNEDLATGLANLATVHALAGRFRKAVDVGGRAGALASQYGYRVGIVARAVVGYALAWSGDFRGAAAALGQAEDAGRGEGGYMFVHAVPFLLEGWLRLGRADEARRVAEDALYLCRDNADAALVAQAEALAGEAALAQGDRERARSLADDAWRGARQGGYPLAEYLALRLRARLALAAGHMDEAHETGAQALARAERAGAQGLAADLAGLLGEVGLATGRPEAATRFRAMQAFADHEAVPYLRALALHGQAAADPDPGRAEAIRLEAQHILRSLAEGLESLPRQAFLGSAACQRVLAEQPAIPVQPLSLDAGPKVFDRIKAVSQDLMGFATQYGAMFREWAATTRQLELLNELAARVSATLELDDILPHVGRLTLELTQAERAFILLEEEGKLTCRMAVGPDGSPLADQRLSMSICQGVLADGKPVAVMDASLGEGFDARASIAELDLRTLMCVPLAARGQTLGVLYVDSRAVVSTFARRDLDLLSAIAGQASMAIANAVLYAESRRRAEDLEKAFGMYREATRQAMTDQLTGLNNRRCFDDLSARELATARAENRPLALLLMDIDHFKSLNDTYGHIAGDLALAEVAKAAQGCVRVRDVAARMGGEEFSVLCPDTTVEAATALAERIREAVAALRLVDATAGPLRQITISIGVATLRPMDTKITDLVARADGALYACKRGGRNQVQLEEPWEEVVVRAKPPVERRKGSRTRASERT